ncbi:MAG: hypothetical protein VX294_13885 [Candidatus Latescibacterota bacterium]|nr:hypothetical protein [Candidatus Latescibacterota bacterium]
MKVHDFFATADTKKRLLTETKDQILSSLRELEFDLQLGKLNDEEYKSLREDLENKAIVVIDQLDRLELENEIADSDLIQKLEVEIPHISQDTQIQTKDLPRASNFCSQCGNKRMKEDKYCTQCGNAFHADL